MNEVKSPKKPLIYYYLAAILLGATMELSEVWAFSDLCNGLMCLPNLTALLLLRRQVGKAHCKTG